MLAMRPAPKNREFCPPVAKPNNAPAPTRIAAQIAQARRDARRDPEQAAKLLRSWMSDHG
jgi:flagellar biosynthesis/type III secretory pathway M-ring protein FliF/YscJ